MVVRSRTAVQDFQFFVREIFSYTYAYILCDLSEVFRNPSYFKKGNHKGREGEWRERGNERTEVEK